VPLRKKERKKESTYKDKIKRRSVFNSKKHTFLNHSKSKPYRIMEKNMMHM
jgi:hypothetical protein